MMKVYTIERTNKYEAVKVSLLFLLFQLGAQQFVLHHFAVLKALPLLVLVQLLSQLYFPIEVVFDLFYYQLAYAFLAERVLRLAVEPADLFGRVVFLMFPPVIPVICLRSVKDMR
jgi:hypothetical protein